MRKLAIALPMVLLMSVHSAAADELRIAVAANFKPTMEQISSAFETRYGHRVLLSGAATGVLYNQIRFGAPFDLLFAADRDSVARLEASGHTGGESGFCYAIGTLVLVGGNGELAQLADPGLSLAIANPATAPYGRAAAEVLARPEFAAGVGRKLVRGSNVAQAFQYWHSGSVELALLPRSLASGTEVPQSWHAPIEQFAVALPRGAAAPAVAAYLDWVRSGTVRQLIIDAGYQPCP